MIKYILISLTVGLLIFSSCKQDTQTTAAKQSPLETAKLAYTETPSTMTAKEYVDAIKLGMADEKADRKTLLVEGLQVSEKNKMGSAAISFLMPLLKDYPTDVESEDRLAKLASALKDLGRDKAAMILADSYYSKYPDGKYKALLVSKVGEDKTDAEAILKEMAEAVFVEPDKYGINRKNAQRYVDACEAFALANPKHDDAPLYLYRGAEMARTLRTFPKALSIYDWIAEKYPNYEKTPTTLFLKGFMLENDLNDKEKAKEVYNQFLTRYPDNALVDDIQFLLDNIDKTDQEIMEMIESKK